jgi:hypothetical protein
MGTRGFHPAAGVSWCVEDRGIRLLAQEDGRTAFLPYPAAALWDLVSRRVPMDRAEAIVAMVAGWQGSTGYVREQLESWMAEGWLEAGGRHG